MIIPDTNVVSESLKPLPSEIVVGWLAGQMQSEVFTTAITLAEVMSGVEALPEGKRRARLLAGVEEIFTQEFPGRILPFDEDAARAYAAIVVRGTQGACQFRSSMP